MKFEKQYVKKRIIVQKDRRFGNSCGMSLSFCRLQLCAAPRPVEEEKIILCQLLPAAPSPSPPTAPRPSR